MVDTLTTNIQLTEIPRGGDTGTWDLGVNGNSTILDTCFGSITTKALSNANIALTVTEAQVAILKFTGILTSAVTVTLPAVIKTWTVLNQTTGNFVITLSPGAGKHVGLPPGDPVDVFSDGTDLYFKSLDRVGSYMDYAGTAVPAWITACSVPPYLNCDGTTFSAVTYPALNAALGGTTLPDLRGRLRAYLNQTTGRITTAGSGVDGNTLFAAGGTENVTLARNQLPNVTLTYSGTSSASGTNTLTGSYTPAGSITGGSPTSLAVFSGSSAVTVQTSGSGATVYQSGSFGSIGGEGFSGTGATISVSGTVSVSGTSAGTTQSLNGNVTQQPVFKMPPVAVGGITLIRAA